MTMGELLVAARELPFEERVSLVRLLREQMAQDGIALPPDMALDVWGWAHQPEVGAAMMEHVRRLKEDGLLTMRPGELLDQDDNKPPVDDLPGNVILHDQPEAAAVMAKFARRRRAAS